MVRPSIAALFAAACAALPFADAAAAVRIVSQPEGAYETLLSDVVLPGSTAGHVIFTPCGDCPRLSLGVTSATRFTVDGRAVTFGDFIAAAEAYRGSGEGNMTAVYVYYDVGSGRVNRLAVDRLAD